MLSDFSSLLQGISGNLVMLLGILVVVTILSLVYYLTFIIIIVLFFNPTFKEAFFSEHKRASLIASLIFLVYVMFGLMYGMAILGVAPSMGWGSTFYFGFVTALVVTIIIQETGKKLWGQKTAFYDAMVSFVAILVFLTPTKTAIKMGSIEGFFFSAGMIIALPFLLLIIKRLKPIKAIIQILYGK